MRANETEILVYNPSTGKKYDRLEDGQILQGLHPGTLSGAGTFTAATTTTGSGTVNISATAQAGALYINAANGAVTYNLPDDATGLYVGKCHFFTSSVDQNTVIKTNTADKLVVLGDATADSVTFSTSSEKIGIYAYACYVGASKWLVVPIVGTATIAT